MLSDLGGPFIRVDRLDLKKYAARPELAKVLFDYILYHDHNPRKALELANYATQMANVIRSARTGARGIARGCTRHRPPPRSAK